QARFDVTSPFTDVEVHGLAVATTNIVQNLDAQDAAAITGTVTDAFTSNPVAFLSVLGSTATGGVTGQTSTCVDGTYRLRLPAGPNGDFVSRGSFDDDIGLGAVYAYQTWDNTAGGTYYPCEGQKIPLATSGTVVSN